MINYERVAGKTWNWWRIVQTVLLVSLVLFTGCSDDSVNPVPNGGGDPVFNDDGGFVITEGMLDRRYNEITFPGTHNSYAGMVFTAMLCRCQGLNVTQQLLQGIRYIDLDVNQLLNLVHGCGCQLGGSINGTFNEIKAYASAHPKQIITVRMSDILTCFWTPCISAECAYHRINGRLEDTGLDEYIYNWDPAKPKDDPGRCHIPDPWPTLREMIESGKNVMFIHHRDCGQDVVLDEAYCLGLNYSNSIGYPSYTALRLEEFCRLMPIWNPPQDRQVDGPHRLLYIECCPDYGAPAGHPGHAACNNDGRRLYQAAKQYEDEVLPDNRVVNFINLDYYMASNAGHLPVDVVDACNRLNYERFGIDWEHSECFWELYPHEFDDSKVKHISRIPSIQAEVDQVIDDFINKRDLDGHQNLGEIVSTGPIQLEENWRRLPEWAVDNDLFTKWGCNRVNNHAWGIDLGERKSIDEIAIAWGVPHTRPGFTVYASNDDSRFGSGISNEGLTNDEGWQVVAQGHRGAYAPSWDVITLNGQGVTDWRYIKIKVTDVSAEWPCFWEVKLYGPAN